MADDTSKSLTPSDLIPADTLAALPLWSEEGLREEIETQLQAAADAMQWDWIPPGEAFDLEIDIARSLLPADRDAAVCVLHSLFPDWRIAVQWSKDETVKIEFFPIRAITQEMTNGI